MNNPCREAAEEYVRARFGSGFTTAEMLIAIADYFLGHKFIEDGSGFSEAHLGLVSLAIKFRRRTDLFLPAILEGWDRERIVREMF